MKFSRMEERTKIINNILKKFYGIRIPALFFDNRDFPYIKYWYDENHDSLSTEYLSIDLNCYPNKNLSFDLFNKLLNEMENKLIQHFKEEKKITLIPYDD